MERKPTIRSELEYDCYNKVLRRLMSKFKDDFYGKKNEEAAHDPKKTWRIINSIYRAKKANTYVYARVIGLTAEEIKNYFALIGEGTRENGRTPSKLRLCHHTPSVNFWYLIYLLLSKL